MSVNSNPALSVVVPVYNAGSRIKQWVKEALSAIKSIPGGAELVLVNDASTDNTWQVLQEMHSNTSSSLRCINLKSNKGQYAATIVGLQKAGGEYLLTIDDDFNPSPACITPFFGYAKQVPLAYGSFDRRADKPFRRLGSRAVHRILQKATGRSLAASGSSFRLIKSGLWQAVRHRLYLPEHLDIELIKAYGKEPLFYNVGAEAIDKSKYSSLKLIKLFLRLKRAPGRNAVNVMAPLLDGSFIANEL